MTQEFVEALKFVIGAHALILINRYGIRPYLRKKLPLYDYLSLQLEHIAHHASLAYLGVEYLFWANPSIDLNIAKIGAATCSFLKGFLQDGYDLTRNKQIMQYDQLTSDAIGSLSLFLLY